jgi:radical SAM superfamily enzyme YgiQ (UPF0313 family)
VSIEELPAVDRTVFDLDFYPHHSLITSRGCPHRCRFCCGWGPGGRRGRSRSPHRIVDELEHLVRSHGAKLVFWADDMFLFSRERRLQLCEEIRRRGLRLRWVVQLRADEVDPDLVEAMAEAGCEKVCLGAESGSDTVLSLTGKGTCRADLERGIRYAVAGGLRVKTWWIAGLPGSTRADERLGMEVVSTCRPHEVAVHTFVPLPGSEYWSRASELGIRLPPADSLESLFYYGRPGDIERTDIAADELSASLEEWEVTLRAMSYVPTDVAAENTPFVYTSPSQRSTFSV